MIAKVLVTSHKKGNVTTRKYFKAHIFSFPEKIPPKKERKKIQNVLNTHEL